MMRDCRNETAADLHRPAVLIDFVMLGQLRCRRRPASSVEAAAPLDLDARPPGRRSCRPAVTRDPPVGVEGVGHFDRRFLGQVLGQVRDPALAQQRAGGRIGGVPLGHSEAVTRCCPASLVTKVCLTSIGKLRVAGDHHVVDRLAGLGLRGDDPQAVRIDVFLLARRSSICGPARPARCRRRGTWLPGSRRESPPPGPPRCAARDAAIGLLARHLA